MFREDAESDTESDVLPGLVSLRESLHSGGNSDGQDCLLCDGAFLQGKKCVLYKCTYKLKQKQHSVENVQK